MKKTENRILNKMHLLKFVLWIAVVGIMLILTPLVFEFASNNLVSNCPPGVDYKSCGIDHGYQELGVGAAISIVWLLSAIILSINCIFRYVKARK